MDEVRVAPRIELPEQEKYWTPRTVYALRQPRSLWEHLPVKPFYYRGVPDGPFRRTWDLLGDGSILCISTPGYTEGACVLRVNSPSGKFALVQSSVAESVFSAFTHAHLFCDSSADGVASFLRADLSLLRADLLLTARGTACLPPDER